MVDITKKHKQFFATALQTTEFRKKWGFHQWICQKKSLLMTVIEAALKLCFWWSKYSWSILLCCCSGKLPKQRHLILYFQPVMSSSCSCAWHRVWNEMILKVPSIPNSSVILWFHVRAVFRCVTLTAPFAGRPPLPLCAGCCGAEGQTTPAREGQSPRKHGESSWPSFGCWCIYKKIFVIFYSSRQIEF